MSETTATTAPSGNEPKRAPATEERSRGNQVLNDILNGNVVISILAVVFALVIGAILIAVTNEDVQVAAGYFFAAPGDTFVSEKLIAFEAGYRGQPTSRTSLSVSIFYNLYDDIRTTEFTGNPLPIQLSNGLEGHSYGIEAWSSTQFTPCKFGTVVMMRPPGFK